MRIAPALLSVILPALLVGSALGALGAKGEVPLSPDAVELDKRMTREKAPDVVLLGNSKVRTDLDHPALQKALGSGPVVSMHVEASSAPTWYAVLENRVYANGYAPRLVVVYGPLSRMLTVKPQGEVDRQRLEAQMGAEEPVLARKVFGREGAGGFMDRARQKRTEVHGAFLEGIKDVAVGLLFRKPEDAEKPLAEAGKAVADPALERVFGEEAAVVQAGRARVIPIAEVETKAIVDRGSSPADTLVPDFVALAKAHGTRIVFVRGPVAPGNTTEDDVDPATERKVLELLNAEGAGWVDLTGLDLAETAFRDPMHMNKKGRDVATAELGRRLVEMDVFGDGPMPAARATVAASRVERVGTPPALPAPEFKPTGTPCGTVAALPALEGVSDPSLVTAGIGLLSPLVVLQDGAPLRAHATREDFAMRCAGAYMHQGREVRLSPTDGVDVPHTYTLALVEELPMRNEQGDEAWWAWPGTSLRFGIDEGWDATRGALAVRAEVRVLGGAGTPALRVAGREMPFPAGGDDRVARLTVDAPPSGAWDIDIVAGEAWVVLERLTVGEGAEAVDLVGREPRPVRLTGGKTTWDAAPAPLTHAAAVEEREGGLRALALPGMGFLSDDALAARTGVPDCSPVRLFANGKVLTAPHTALDVVGRLGGGRYHHAEDALLFGAPNELAPAGATYTAALDPGRKCEGGHWLFPGDRLVAYANQDDLRSLRHGARRMALTATAFTPDGAAPEPLTVRLKHKGEVKVEAQLDPATLTGAPRLFPLDPKLPPRTVAVELEVVNPRGGAWVLLNLVTLDEAREDEEPRAAGAGAAVEVRP